VIGFGKDEESRRGRKTIGGAEHGRSSAEKKEENEGKASFGSHEFSRLSDVGDLAGSNVAGCGEFVNLRRALEKDFRAGKALQKTFVL